MSRVLSFTTTEDSDIELDELMEIWGMNRSETIREAISRAYNRQMLFSKSPNSHQRGITQIAIQAIER